MIHEIPKLYADDSMEAATKVRKCKIVFCILLVIKSERQFASGERSLPTTTLMSRVLSSSFEGSHPRAK